MNQQCEECKIRKFCVLDEPEEDYTCESFVDESEYIRYGKENCHNGNRNLYTK